MPRGVGIAALIGVLASGSAGAAIELRVWHTLSEAPAKEFGALIERYNGSQTAVRVRPARRAAPAVLASGLGARPAGAAPHIVQLPEVATADALAAGAALRPLWQAMDDAGLRHDPRAFAPAVAGTYADAKGRLLALPWDTATPILYLNRDAWRRARLDPDHPPRTWDDMTDALAALVDAGARCPFTVTSPSWVLLENMSAWHNEAFATRGNGFDGPGARLAFNTGLGVRWIARLSTWTKTGYFSYSGRDREGEKRFASGECAALIASSASDAALRRAAKFDVGVAQMPYYDDFLRAPQNTLAGGGALWVTRHGSRAERRAAAAFLAWLLRPEVQVAWHQKTGFVPLRADAYEKSKKDGFYRAHPAAEIAVRQLLFREPTADSTAIRLARFARIRTIIEDELEAVWRGKKGSRAALDAAVERGNALLAEAERAAALRTAARAPR